MGTHHLKSVMTAIGVGIGVKLLFLSPHTSAMDSSSITHLIRNPPMSAGIAPILPLEQYCDMTLIFPGGDCDL
jgi:hypothetical protein